MAKEDYYARAALNLLDFQLAKFKLQETTEQLKTTQDSLAEKTARVEQLESTVTRYQMLDEDFQCQVFYLQEERMNLGKVLSLVKQKCETLDQTNKHLKIEAEQKLKYQSDFNDIEKKYQNIKKELNKMKTSHDSNAPAEK